MVLSTKFFFFLKNSLFFYFIIGKIEKVKIFKTAPNDSTFVKKRLNAFISEILIDFDHFRAIVTEL